jgi:hypothetical protein
MMVGCPYAAIAEPEPEDDTVVILETPKRAPNWVMCANRPNQVTSQNSAEGSHTWITHVVWQCV